MRYGCVVLGLLVGAQSWAAGPPQRPISPAEAAKAVDQKCTVLMEVKSIGKDRRGRFVFLNSEANYRDGKNFTLVIDRSALENFKKASIADPAAHFKGERVLVTGKVTLFQNRPQIKIDDPTQIKIMKKKG
jgi:DNA/RNA endonuclease YhcR with UshA esterase domain